MTADVVKQFSELFGVSEDAIRAVVGADDDSVPPTETPGGLPVPAAAPPLPEPGQVVEVRGSTWAVANLKAQGLPRSPADEASAHLNHVVVLQSLDEDRLGEQLSVIWELEVGQTVTPAQGLPEHINPEAFDDPSDLAGFIDAMRWGASPRPTRTATRRPSGRVRRSRPISLSRCAAPWPARAPTCCWPTTSAWVRPSKPAWSSRSSS